MLYCPALKRRSLFQLPQELNCHRAMSFFFSRTYCMKPVVQPVVTRRRHPSVSIRILFVIEQQPLSFFDRRKPIPNSYKYITRKDNFPPLILFLLDSFVTVLYH